MFDVSESMRSSCRPASTKSLLRVASSVAGSCSRSTNARNAASGVRSSCDTSARCSCPRSRSRRSACIDPCSRSAMRLNWSSSATISSFAATSIPVGTRAERFPSLISVAVSERSCTGFANRAAAIVETIMATIIARMPTKVIVPVIPARRDARVVSGEISVTSMLIDIGAPPIMTTFGSNRMESRASPGSSTAPSELIRNSASAAGEKNSWSGFHVPNRTRTSARAMSSASCCNSGSCNKNRSRTSSLSSPLLLRMSLVPATLCARLRAALDTAAVRASCAARSCISNSCETRSTTR